MGEGLDSKKRGTFTPQQLVQATDAFDTSNVKLLMPILGETGCRLGEIVGLRKEDVCLATNTLNINNTIEDLKLSLVPGLFLLLDTPMKHSR